MRFQMVIEFEAPKQEEKVFEALVPITILSIMPAGATQNCPKCGDVHFTYSEADNMDYCDACGSPRR